MAPGPTMPRAMGSCARKKQPCTARSARTLSAWLMSTVMLYSLHPCAIDLHEISCARLGLCLARAAASGQPASLCLLYSIDAAGTACCKEPGQALHVRRSSETVGAQCLTWHPTTQGRRLLGHCSTAHQCHTRGSAVLTLNQSVRW